MREIKFRAWDKPGELMVYSGLEFSTDVDGDEHNSYVYLVPSKNAGKFYELTVMDNSRVDKMEFEGELMQYTGLKDKAGKEIYEGDIIPNNANEKGVTVFDNGSFCWQYPDKSDTWSLVGIDIKDWEVIGNIYENPELLEPKSEEMAS